MWVALVFLLFSCSQTNQTFPLRHKLLPMCHSSTSTASPMLSYLVCAMGHLHLNKLNEYYPSSRINHEFDLLCIKIYKNKLAVTILSNLRFWIFSYRGGKNIFHSKGRFFNSLSKLCKIIGEVLSLPQIIDYSHNNQV